MRRISIESGTGKMNMYSVDKAIAAECTVRLGVRYSHEGQFKEYGNCEFDYSLDESKPDLNFKATITEVILEGTWRECDWGFELYLSVSNTGEGFVHAVTVRIDGLQMTNESMFALPHGAGFTVPLSKMEETQCIKLHYPVFCSMQWVDLFTADKGIYLGVCDELPRSKIFTTGKEHNSPYMEVCFSDLYLKPHDTSKLPAVQVMAHEGDWRKGSDHYRQWFESVFNKPVAPEWCSKSPVWAWANCKLQHADHYKLHFNQLPEHMKSFSEIGIQTMQVSGYLEKGHDALYPDYLAGPCMGGDEALQNSIKQIHDQGGRLTLYTNGRLADPESSIGEQENWAEWCVAGLSLDHLLKMNHELRFGAANSSLQPAKWDSQGICYKETYGEVDFAVMCPSSHHWRMFFINKLEELIRRYQPDGIYLDQVCGAWGLTCYSQLHDHKQPCDAWCGYTNLLRELSDLLRNIVPNIYLATEGVNDILGINIDIFQAHNWGFRFGLPQCAEPAPDIFIYTLPQYLLYLGPVFKNDFRELRRAFAYGRGLDIAIESMDDCSESFIRELKFAVESRNKLCPDLLSAKPEYIHTGKDYRCFLFILPDKKPVLLGSVISNTQEAAIDLKIVVREFCNCHVKVITPIGEKTLYCDDTGELKINEVVGMCLIMKETDCQ